MWLENLKEIKKEKHLSAKQIAQKANMSERTVTRIFSGDTAELYVDTLQRIAAALERQQNKADKFAELVKAAERGAA